MSIRRLGTGTFIWVDVSIERLPVKHLTLKNCMGVFSPIIRSQVNDIVSDTKGL